MHPLPLPNLVFRLKNALARCFPRLLTFCHWSSLKGSQMLKVYRNLTRRTWSLKEGKAPVAHAPSLVLRDVVFRVSEARRQAVIRSGWREVHAWAIGAREGALPVCHVQVTYNPHLRGEFFEVKTGRAVKAADFVSFELDGTAWASGVTYAD